MKTIIILILSLCLFQCSKANQYADQATPEEAISKVHKAAALLRARGDAALEILRNPNSEFVWKDSYVFVVNCEADLVLSNPVFPERQGGDIKQHLDYNGKQYGLKLCGTANNPKGGWVEYVWPKPGGGTPSRKISYVISVNNYQVGAGVYHETISLEELNWLIERD